MKTEQNRAELRETIEFAAYLCVVGVVTVLVGYGIHLVGVIFGAVLP